MQREREKKRKKGGERVCVCHQQTAAQTKKKPFLTFFSQARNPDLGNATDVGKRVDSLLQAAVCNG